MKSHEYNELKNLKGDGIIVGADRLFSEFSHLIDGKNIALVSNHSGRLNNGTHLADAMYEYPNAELVTLFGMEFNIRSNDYSISKDEQADTDRDLFEPYKAGIAMVWAIHKLHAEKMIWDQKVLARLTGTCRLVNMIQAGSEPDKIFTSWKTELAKFKQISEQYMLY